MCVFLATCTLRIRTLPPYVRCVSMEMRCLEGCTTYTRWSSRYIHIYKHLPYHDVGMCISLPAATQSCPALNVAALIVGTCIMVASLLYQPPRDLSSRARSRPSFPSTAASDISFGAAASPISARRIRTRAPSPPLPASTSSKSAPSPLARL